MRHVKKGIASTSAARAAVESAAASVSSLSSEGRAAGTQSPAAPARVGIALPLRENNG
jgi:hypothetical protein